jgi:5-methylcytosine-specific restriction endonuclease McrA
MRYGELELRVLATRQRSIDAVADALSAFGDFDPLKKFNVYLGGEYLCQMPLVLIFGTIEAHSEMVLDANGRVEGFRAHTSIKALIYQLHEYRGTWPDVIDEFLENARRYCYACNSPPSSEPKAACVRSIGEWVGKTDRSLYDFLPDVVTSECSSCRISRRAESIRQHGRTRQIHELYAEGSHTDKEWQDLLECCSYKCLSCGAENVKLTKDHIQPISKGGSNWISNIQPLCQSCNSAKGVQTIDYRSEVLKSCCDSSLVLVGPEAA